MAREFGEETTCETHESRWKCFCVEGHPDYEVHFFKASLTVDEVLHTMTKTVNDVDEELRWMFVNLLIAGACSTTIGNLHWLIPMAQDWRDFQCRLTVKGNISERPTW